ncbi:MAG: beta-ketoacyl synthase N-terminal-like domain-containing protein [Dehalococcoidia bacterium]
MRKPKRSLGRGVAVVGAGMSKFGLFDDRDSLNIFAEAYTETISSVEKGIDPQDMDAVYFGNFASEFFVHQGHWGPIIADLLGHTPKPCSRVEGACASGAAAFREAVFAIASGFYDIVLVGGVEEMSKCSTPVATEGLSLGGFIDEAKTGFTFPGLYGTRAVAYFNKYGITRENLMHVTIKSHHNAAMNPKAQFGVSIQGIMNNRIERARQKGQPLPAWKDEMDFLRDRTVNPMISWPLHLYDCCPISDGASCTILVAEELARDFTDSPVFVAGLGQGSSAGLRSSDNLTSLEGAKYAAAEAFEMSGLTPEDIQFAEVHDCFSIAEIIATEDLGFFPPGEGCKAAEAGLTSLDGPKPINTSGGLKCKGHPVGATGVAQLTEVWTQLRGEAGPRQIANPNLAIGAAHNVGGHGGTCLFTILERR